MAIRTEITKLLSTSPKLLSSDTQLVMRERYETVFGIHNHDAPDVDPLALVILHPAENSSQGGRFHQRVKDHIAFDVAKYTGLSLKELMSYPTEKVEIILQECRGRQERDSKVASNLPPL